VPLPTAEHHTHSHSHHNHTNLNLRAAFIHVLGDLVQSVGVLIAAIIIKFTGFVLADPICTFLFGILVLVSFFRWHPYNYCSKFRLLQLEYWKTHFMFWWRPPHHIFRWQKCVPTWCPLRVSLECIHSESGAWNLTGMHIFAKQQVIPIFLVRQFLYIWM
jgi:hypothetical protein